MTLKHSFSSISTYLQCPRKFEALYVLRTAKDESAAIDEGHRVHKAIEDFINGVGPRPDRGPEGNLLDLLKSAGAKTEAPLAMKKDGSPCDFWDNDVYIRAKLDILLVTASQVCIIDWKTGKKRQNKLQGDVYGTLARTAHPGKVVKVSFDYLEKGRQPAQVVTAGDAEVVLATTAVIDRATFFPPKPTPLCGWCAVKTCEYWKPRP